MSLEVTTRCIVFKEYDVCFKLLTSFLGRCVHSCFKFYLCLSPCCCQKLEKSKQSVSFITVWRSVLLLCIVYILTFPLSLQQPLWSNGNANFSCVKVRWFEAYWNCGNFFCCSQKRRSAEQNGGNCWFCFIFFRLLSLTFFIMHGKRAYFDLLSFDWCIIYYPGFVQKKDLCV